MIKNRGFLFDQIFVSITLECIKNIQHFKAIYMQQSHQEQFTHFLTTALNDEQQSIVTKHQGVILVRAGAGSGKTRVITARITHLIMHHHYDPTSILALTFTNKAAREMQERVKNFLGSESTMPFVGTFHSYCLRLLKANSHLLSSPMFSIMDDDDQQKLLRSIITKHGVQKKITPTAASHTISRLKNDAFNGALQLHTITDPLLAQIIQLYEQEKKAAHCFDFDDLLLETLRLLRNNEGFKLNFQQKIRHILIDEYQDTNLVQHALLKEFALHNNQFAIDSLCVVGDEDQSIYSWRGATIANILHFQKDFPHALDVTIQQNYRSVQQILDAANGIIKHNSQRKRKTLWSEREGNDRVRILACMSNYQEADVVAQLALSAAPSAKLGAVAVLYRAHYQSRTLEEALIKHSIPYKIIGGIQFYERQEIKDLLAYLRLVVNPYERISFMRVINIPTRGLGDKFEEQFLTLWEQQPFATMHDIGTLMIQQNMLSKSKQDALKNFLAIFDGINPTQLPSQALDTIIKRVQYLTYLKQTLDPEEAQVKIENIKELIHAITALEEAQQVTNIADFLNDVALLQEQSKAPVDEQQCLRLMTLHAAKGLEFETVIITGLEEGMLPSGRSIHEQESLEEERRLLYVGITRAQERLLLTHSRYRYQWGAVNDQRISRFIQELPHDVPHHEAVHWNTLQIKQYIDQWLTNKSAKPAVSTKNKQSAAATATTWADDPFESSSPWKIKQQISHARFGNGVIEHIEERAAHTVLTIRFATGTKKLDAKFVKHM